MAYCQKEDTREAPGETFGERVQPGRRTDLEGVREMLDCGSSILEVAQENFGMFCRYERSFRSYKRMITSPTKPTTDVILCLGPTNVGKSHWCQETYPKAYWKTRGDWFDEYEGQECVIVDEFYGWLPFDFLLRLMDKYSMLLPIKSNFVRAKFKTLVFTSNTKPQLWYDYSKPGITWAALKRRFTCIKYWRNREQVYDCETFEQVEKIINFIEN